MLTHAMNKGGVERIPHQYCPQCQQPTATAAQLPGRTEFTCPRCMCLSRVFDNGNTGIEIVNLQAVTK